MNSRYTWLNGQMIESSRTTIPLLTSGFHYGIGVFEGIRAYATDRGPAVFRLREHLERFESSARILGFLEVPYSVAELTAATAETIRANGYDECYIRPLLYLGEGGWNLTLDTGKAHVAIAVWQESVYLGHDSPKRGLRANVSSFARSHPGANMTKAKICGNYVNSYLAKTESHRLGFDEAILLDPEGFVAECTGANLFLVRHGKLVTPSSETILEGITRNTVTTFAADLGIPVFEGRVSRDQLYLADEVFVCGTAAEIVGLCEVDGRRVGTGETGPLTRRLQQIYADAVHGRHPRSPEWLEYVGVAAAKGV
ncbi:MAG TPA: branched-chain amino acid transaminase [Vicinamibacterales bacterium]|nr:branched-chain amino acid transaminase [Vicinamibacterales bacterium]